MPIDRSHHLDVDAADIRVAVLSELASLARAAGVDTDSGTWATLRASRD